MLSTLEGGDIVIVLVSHAFNDSVAAAITILQ